MDTLFSRSAASIATEYESPLVKYWESLITKEIANSLYNLRRKNPVAEGKHTRQCKHDTSKWNQIEVGGQNASLGKAPKEDRHDFIEAMLGICLGKRGDTVIAVSRN